MMAASMEDNTNPMPVLSAADPTHTAEVDKVLPKLSAAEFRAYNRLAVMMDAYVSSS